MAKKKPAVGRIPFRNVPSKFSHPSFIRINLVKRGTRRNLNGSFSAHRICCAVLCSSLAVVSRTKEVRKMFKAFGGDLGSSGSTVNAVAKITSYEFEGSYMILFQTLLNRLNRQTKNLSR